MFRNAILGPFKIIFNQVKGRFRNLNFLQVGSGSVRKSFGSTTLIVYISADVQAMELLATMVLKYRYRMGVRYRTHVVNTGIPWRYGKI
jgi:hypothetical protein